MDRVLIDPTRHRSLAWKLFLGHISGGNPDTWVEETCTRRADYAILRDKLMLDPTKKKNAEAADPLLDNPLSVSEDSTWNKYFQDEELIAEIDKDLARLTPIGNKEELFQSEDTIQLMRSVLFLWSKEHPDTSYRQGMHDLLGIIIYVLSEGAAEAEHAEVFVASAPAKAAPPTPPTAEASEDSAAADSSETGANAVEAVADEETEAEIEKDNQAFLNFDATCRILCDWENAEGDAHFLFTALMDYMLPLYQVDSKEDREARMKERKKKNSKAPDLGGGALGISTEGLLGIPEKAAAVKNTVFPIQTISKHIYEVLLRRIDPSLYSHLAKVEVQPELFLLRWLRLLFAREFHISDILCIWDELLASTVLNATEASKDSGFKLLQEVCAVMIWQKREHLLQSDFSGCLQQLMQGEPPTPGEMPTLLQKAKDIADPTRMAEVNQAVQQEGWVVVKPLSAEGRPWCREYHVICGCNAKHFATFQHSLAHFNIRSAVITAVTVSTKYQHACVVTTKDMGQYIMSCDSAEDLGAWMGALHTAVDIHSKVAKPLPPLIEVVTFVDGPLGVILKQPAAHRGGPLEVSGFKDDPGGGPGQAARAEVLVLGDQLEAVNGIDATDLSMRELVTLMEGVGARPLYLAFRHKVEIEAVADIPNPLGALNPPPAPAGERSEPSLKGPVLLDGEVVFATVEAALEEIHFIVTMGSTIQRQYAAGMIFLTNYRCCFFAYVDGDDRTPRWQIPMMMIDSVRGTSNDGGGSTQALQVAIYCKDGQEKHLSFATTMVYMRLQQCLQALAFPGDIAHTFAFQHKLAAVELPAGWMYDPITDYKRIGLIPPVGETSMFRVFKNDFSLCSTYPENLVVPGSFTDEELFEVGQFRSRGRIPVVTWQHPKSKAVIARCAQPLVGLNSKRCSADEKLLQVIANCGAQKRALYILDARSQLASAGNRALGKGTEMMAHYPGMRLAHMSIANIHVCRDSLKKMFALADPSGVANSESHFLSKLEGAGWLNEVRKILQSSVRMSTLVEKEGLSVLNHCSDGWDRTAQMCAMAELLMDPHYRTLEGFGQLIEKHWCSFGHQFRKRCGHADSNAGSDQKSPCLLLWLDCVWQITLQHSHAYEFNEDLLIAIADHTYSCRFGTFLCNCPREQAEAEVWKKTTSLWAYVYERRADFTNPNYKFCGETLYPNCNPKNVRIWENYFFRWDTTLVPQKEKKQFY